MYLQSGSPLADWAAIDDIYRVQNTSRVYGLEVGCSVESSYKLMQCLNRRNYEELASAPIVVRGRGGQSSHLMLIVTITQIF